MLEDNLLTDNQKTWLSMLENNYHWYGNNFRHGLYATLCEGLPWISDDEFIQVMQLFNQWLMEIRKKIIEKRCL